MFYISGQERNTHSFFSWTVTVLRQGSVYRIQIEYTGRPAIVSYPEDMTPSRVPPFLEVVDQ
jgi:hypothetical protein